MAKKLAGWASYNRMSSYIPAIGGAGLVPDTRAVTLVSGSSPFTYTSQSGKSEMVIVGAGTVSQIDFIRNAVTTTLTSVIAGTFMLNNGDALKVTYAVAPTINVIPIAK